MIPAFIRSLRWVEMVDLDLPVNETISEPFNHPFLSNDNILDFIGLSITLTPVVLENNFISPKSSLLFFTCTII